MANEEFKIDYKIGDKVVCPEVPANPNECPSFRSPMERYLGEVGEIVDTSSVTKSFEVRFPSTGETFFFRPQWIIHHKEPDEEFKIGDKVFCREVPADTLEGPTFSTAMEKYLGEVGEIVSSRSKITGAFKVRFPSTGCCFFFMPHWLTKLSIHRGYAPLIKPDSPLLKGDYETVDDGVDMKRAFAEAMEGDFRQLGRMKRAIPPSKTDDDESIKRWIDKIPKPNEDYLTSSVDEKPETPPKWRFGRFRYVEPSRMVDVVFEGKWEKGNVQGR